MRYKVSVIIETEYIDQSILLEAIQEWAEHRTDDEEMTENSACVEALFTSVGGYTLRPLHGGGELTD